VTRPPLALIAVVGLLVAGTAVATAAGPAAPARTNSAKGVDVVGATAVCPDLRQGAGLTSRVSAGSAATGTGGSVHSSRLDPVAPAVPARAAGPGQTAVAIGADVTDDALVVAANGPLAGGLEVEQLTRGDTGQDRGLAGLRCGPPTTEAWFLGGSSVVGESTVLVLVNADDVPALVDVTVSTATGPQDPRPGEGFAVGPHSRTFVPLDTLAAGKDLLALHVHARRGRVAAAVRHSRYDGQVSHGVEWVPPSLPPATTVVVPGLPAGPGHRYALVTNPGTDDTTVSIRVTTSEGQFLPTGFEAVDVPAGHTVRTELDPLTDRSALALRVVSTGAPILAGGYVVDGPEGGAVAEIAYTTASLPLDGPALLTDVDLNPATRSTLVLSALAGPGAVLLRPRPIAGSAARLPVARTVPVPAGRTSTVELSSLLAGAGEGRFALEVSPAPGSAPVYAARYLTETGSDGPLTTLLDLQSPPEQVLRPAVQRDPGAAG